MGRHEHIAAHLPILYRPDEGDDSLFSSLLAATGASLDAVSESAGEVLQSHWFRHADKASLEKFFFLQRQVRSIAPARTGDLLVLADPPSFAATLDASADALSTHLRQQLSARARGLLAGRDPAKPPSTALQYALLDDLGAICADSLLFTPERFAGITLTPAMTELLGVAVAPEELPRLNARLLVEAFPKMLSLNHADSPYVRDLGRCAAMLSLPPWREPTDLAESVEDYRLRLSRTVSLYRKGVATLGSIARMIEAQLPPDRASGFIDRDREFSLEEFSPFGLTPTAAPAQGKIGVNTHRARAYAGPIVARGEPTGLLGPLMSFTLHNTGLSPAPPTFYITGTQPVPDHIDPTAGPLIELYSSSKRRRRIGLGYRDTIPPNVTLRFRPAYAAWLATDDGVQAASSRPTDTAPADPTAPGPFAAVQGGPPGVVTSIASAEDNSLWAATTEASDHDLWRFDGSAWVAVAQLAATANALLADDEQLFVATDSGLFTVPLFPSDGVFTPSPVEAVGDRAVLTLRRTAASRIWIGTDEGAFTLSENTLSPTPIAGVEVNDIFQDRGGTLLFATGLGVILHRPAFDQWFILRSGGISDQDADWLLFSPAPSGADPALPPDADVFIPPVRRVFRHGDGTIWIGSEHGIARYLARRTSDAGPLSYETVLEAFPDLTPGTVHDILQDERGLLWFATDRGILRFDGRQFAQFRAPGPEAPPDSPGNWARLGLADLLPDPLPEPRGNWRFDRAALQWQRSTVASPIWSPFIGAAPRTTPEPTVRSIVWTDSVEADFGTWDGSVFTVSNELAADPAKLVSRVKPTETRIVAAGIPAMPRVPVGASLWRYLSLEEGVPDPTDDPPPADDAPPIWTTEGRLIPRPPDRRMVVEGRFNLGSAPRGEYDNSVFTYPPAAAISIDWRVRAPHIVLARLRTRFDSETIHSAILDRVWHGINQVRPAGVRLLLAVENNIVRGLDHG